MLCELADASFSKHGQLAMMLLVLIASLQITTSIASVTCEDSGSLDVVDMQYFGGADWSALSDDDASGVIESLVVSDSSAWQEGCLGNCGGFPDVDFETEKVAILKSSASTGCADFRIASLGACQGDDSAVSFEMEVMDCSVKQRNAVCTQALAQTFKAIVIPKNQSVEFGGAFSPKCRSASSHVRHWLAVVSTVLLSAALAYSML